MNIYLAMAAVVVLCIFTIGYSQYVEKKLEEELEEFKRRHLYL